MPGAVVCGDRFHRIDGIYKSTNSDHACVRAKNVGDIRRYPLALQSYAGTRYSAQPWRLSGDEAGVSFSHAYVLARVVGHDSRGTTGGGRVGSAEHLQVANREPSLDLCRIARLTIVFLPGKFHRVCIHT